MKLWRKVKRFNRRELAIFKEFARECRETDKKYQYYDTNEKLKRMKRLFLSKNVVYY